MKTTLSVSVLFIVGPKCMLVKSLAALWRVMVSMQAGTDRWTDTMTTKKRTTENGCYHHRHKGHCGAAAVDDQVACAVFSNASRNCLGHSMSDSVCDEALSHDEPSRNTVPARPCPVSATATLATMSRTMQLADCIVD